MAIETDEALRDLLRRVRSIAVVGIKAGASDDAFRVPQYMQEQGYRILPISPKLDRVLGEKCVPSLAALDETPDLVNVFRASAHVPHHVEEVLSLPGTPAGVWLQLGIRHPDATRRLDEAGISVVEDRCLMVEHRRLLNPGG
jgi:predicted CoA-binding protein